MKKLKLIFSMIFVMSFFGLQAQEADQKLDKGVEQIKIKTSSQCEQCKERIEKEMAFEKGVKAVELDLETNIVTIQYKTAKTTPEKLRKAIAEIGYDADDVPADPKAYEKLPTCCKKGGHDHEH